jgi:hypothetical protein
MDGEKSTENYAKESKYNRWDGMRKMWILLANWAISPLWYVLGMFIYFMADGVASGQCVCTGLLDIIMTILIALFLIPTAAVMYLSHYPFHLLTYYAISGTMIYATYRIYKKHTLKESGAK